MLNIVLNTLSKLLTFTKVNKKEDINKLKEIYYIT